MKPVTASELRTILHSKRANIYYLEHCRVLVNGGRVEYVTDAGFDRAHECLHRFTAAQAAQKHIDGIHLHRS